MRSYGSPRSKGKAILHDVITSFPRKTTWPFRSKRGGRHGVGALLGFRLLCSVVDCGIIESTSMADVSGPAVGAAVLNEASCSNSEGAGIRLVV